MDHVDVYATLIFNNNKQPGSSIILKFILILIYRIEIRLTYFEG